MFIKYILELSGLGDVSSNYLGVNNDSANSMRRKSDSRLDMHQVAHLQNLAAKHSNNASNALTLGETSLRKSDRNLIQNQYNPTDQQYWNQQQHQAQNYNDIHLRGGISTDRTIENYDTELGHRQSALGPFQIMPPQPHGNYRLDCKITYLSYVFSNHITIYIYIIKIIDVALHFLISVSYCGEMKLGFFLSHNHLQVDIVLARNVTIGSKQIPHNSSKNT